jgi:Rrf2 family protein
MTVVDGLLTNSGGMVARLRRPQGALAKRTGVARAHHPRDNCRLPAGHGLLLSRPMISQKARYAFKALFALVRAEGRLVQSREIAAAENIPQSFLEQILLELRRAGLVGSRRGKVGGHYLLKDPAKINCGQVLRLIDGPIAPLPCLSRTAYRRCDDCRDEQTCAVRHLFADGYAAMIEALEAASLLAAARRAEGEPPVDSHFHGADI